MITPDLKLEQSVDGKKLVITDLTVYTGYDSTSITGSVFTILNLYDNRNVTLDVAKHPIGGAVVELDSFDLGFTAEGETKSVLPDAVYITKLTYTITKDDLTTEEVVSQDTIITFYNADCCGNKKAPIMLEIDDCCKNKDVTQYWTVWMYIQAAKSLHSCGTYNKAQVLLNKANKLCNYNNCGCN